MREPIVVVGAGAAGILAAWRAATLGAKVILLEKTERLGSKILISGGGKCNVAHDGPLEDVIRAFRPNEARWLRAACYRLPNIAIMEMMTSRGLEIYTRPDGRVFPVHQTAKDVVGILRSYLHDAGVEIRFGSPVTAIEAPDGHITGVRARDTLVETSHLILATGGSSYPKTGTTGDGWPWARQLGHSVVPIRSALAPMTMEIDDMDPRAGISLQDVVLKARQNGKEISRFRGALLFTHRGISGPVVLGASRNVAERFSEGPVEVLIDILPDARFEDVGEAILTYAKEHPRRSVATYLATLVPERLAEEIAGDFGSTAMGQLPVKARNRLVETLKGWSLGRVRSVPLEKGECVAGGISLDEVDPQTMRSLRCEGLYLCGEVLDVAGPVGGYNLQAAFATGFVAGETAGKDWLG